MSLIQKKTEHQVGVGLRRPHFEQFEQAKPESVSWIEVVSENYMQWEDSFEGFPLQRLEKLREKLPVYLHGVSLSLGSVDALSKSHLQRLKNLIDRIQPEFVSDHLCWTGLYGQNFHDLLPLPMTEETVRHVVERIDQVQSFLKSPILIENVSSYVRFQQDEMPEWHFLREILDRSGCFLLADINNIYVNSVNHSFEPLDYLKSIPSEKVKQIHLAGHSVQEACLIDTHGTPVCEEVWALYRESFRLWGERPTMIERDSNIPTWDEMEKEISRIHQIQEEEAEHVVAAASN